MPMYNVEHSFPLSNKQKADLAGRITNLHATAFKTPSIFVQVKYFQEDASAHNHFVGGQHKDEATNRITGYVRTSAGRKKEHFDKLAEDIENAWYVVLGERSDEVNGDEKEKKKDEKESSQKERDAKELLSVIFIGGLMGREKGFVLPEAGQEDSWFKQYRKDFENRAEMGDKDWKGVLEEVETRDDLKSWRE